MRAVLFDEFTDRDTILEFPKTLYKLNLRSEDYYFPIPFADAKNKILNLVGPARSAGNIPDATDAGGVFRDVFRCWR